LETSFRTLIIFVFDFRYLNLDDIADHYFPPVIHEHALEASEFSNTTFWRRPIEDIDLSELKDPGGASK